MKKYIFMLNSNFPKFKNEEDDVVHDLENAMNLHFEVIPNRERGRGNTIRSRVNF